MSFASDLLPSLHDIRAIPGELGLRPHTVAIVTGSWSGVHTGDGTGTDASLAVTHADGQPPKVRWMNDEQIVLAGLPKGSCTIGPITPTYPALAALTGIDLLSGQTLHVRITGPNHPTGARYRVTEIKTDRVMHYMLTAVPVKNE